MAKTFKKNQKIIATLPTGRRVEGIYIEPYGTDGHSFYANDFNGIGPDGEPIYAQKRYGVKEEFIDAVTDDNPEPSDMQYKAWLKRASELEARIKADKEEVESLKKMGVEEKSNVLDKLAKKIERNQSKLDEINEKIDEFEGED